MKQKQSVYYSDIQLHLQLLAQNTPGFTLFILINNASKFQTKRLLQIRFITQIETRGSFLIVSVADTSLLDPAE